MSAHGVLVVDKPEGPTSHDVVAAARRLYGTASLGHAGTLDPMASGVLLLLMGEATKLSGYLTNEDKRYRARVRFGRATDTLDATGATLCESELGPDWCEPARLEQALELERQRRLQAPPAHSAIKIAGRPAHRRARAGERPVLAERPVEVAELTLVEHDATSATLELSVSKGYYVRALARDLGQALGVPAHLEALRRLSSGSWTLAESVPWPLGEPALLVPTRDAALRCLSKSQLTEQGALRCRHGKPLGDDDFVDPPRDARDVQAWLSPSGALLAVGRTLAPGEYRVVRGFRTE